MKTLEEAIAKIGELVALVEAQTVDITKLKEKNAEILSEKKELQATVKELKAKSDTPPTPATPPPDKDEPKTTRDLRERIEAPLVASIKELQTKFDTMQAERDTLAVETALDDALKVAGVAVPYHAAAKALLRSSRKIELANGAVTCDGKAVKDSVVEWAKTDEGKPFVAAPSNGGGAAPGNGASGEIPKKRSEMDASAKGAFIAKHGLQAYSALS